MMDRSPGATGLKLVERMQDLTLERNGEKILANAERNAAFLDRGESLKALRTRPLGAGDSAVIIAAGPSVKHRNPLRLLVEHGYRGAIIATDSAIYYCLRNGVVPDLVVSLDPDASRIVRWFGDPELTADSIEADDYFRRQDMEAAFADELETNRRIMALVAEHGPKMRIALCTSASEKLAKRILETGMQIYWWNPMLDDPDADGVTRRLMRLNGLPCLNTGGNVGTACWMMAHAVLGKKQVALTGVDFSYYGDTPYTATQYYREIVEIFGEDRLDDVFIRIRNPYTDSWFYTDPAYMWYREGFLDLAEIADCETYNCTEGGILFGDHVTFAPLRSFLDRVDASSGRGSDRR